MTDTEEVLECGHPLSAYEENEHYTWCSECSVNFKHKTRGNVDHPDHYGGKDNPYEAIKVIEAWGLNFNLGNAAKYISRASKKGKRTEDLEKAVWYLKRELSRGGQR